MGSHIKLPEALSQQTKELRGLEYRLNLGSISIKTLIEKPEILDQYKRDHAHYLKLTSNQAVMAAVRAEISSFKDADNDLWKYFIFSV